MCIGSCYFAPVQSKFCSAMSPMCRVWGTILWWPIPNRNKIMMTSSNGNIFCVLALCAGNSSVICEIFVQRPVMRSFDYFFDVRLNKRLSKQSWGWWFETPSCSLWRHCNDITRHKPWGSRDQLYHHPFWTVRLIAFYHGWGASHAHFCVMPVKLGTPFKDGTGKHIIVSDRIWQNSNS